MFEGKTLLITGGTGSFGNAVLDRILKEPVKEVRIFSRDEKKQDDMRQLYQNEKIRFYIGDVRDGKSVKNVVKGVDYIFHAAALKQVPSCEFFPMEAIKTNVIGAENVITAAIEEGVKKVVFLSTDKAAYPVNAMGMSKALMEKIVVSHARLTDPKKTSLCCTRYGNVLCSRGSVVPLFMEQIKQGRPITVTMEEMTRFVMSLEEAVELVLFAFQYAETGDIMVQKAPSCTIKTLAQAVNEICNNNNNNNTNIIGIRHGEKIYETLLTDEEYMNAIDMGNFYRVPADTRTLNYELYFEKGEISEKEIRSFNSSNTVLLSVGEVKEKLLELDYVKNELKSWSQS